MMILAFSVLSTGQDRVKRPAERARIDADGKLTSTTIKRIRRSFDYDDGGLFECSWATFESLKGTQDDPCKEKVIRDFIWDHFSAKKRGYIRIKNSDIDSTVVEHIFIEPQQRGRWMVTWWSVTYHFADLRAPRIKIWPRKLLIPEKVISKQTGNWKLVFANNEGKVLEKIPLLLNEY